MRTCPACKAEVEPGQTRCAACGGDLGEAEELAVSLSDTVASGSPTAAAAAAPTPSPLVRVNPTPNVAAAAQVQVGGDSIVGASLADRYQVTRKIGEGGMGAVYEARHTLIGKRVAIKVLLDKYANKPDVVARLQQEARLASSIGHEHIVDITDFGQTDDGRTFVVMEFLEGESLAHLLAREGPLAPARAVEIARQVANALGAAHQKGIVHRDVKPENVFIIRRAERDFAKVVDFGISKAMRPVDDTDEAGVSLSPRLTQTGMVLGTPLYMSPEQACGEEALDHRIDIYAVGVILYEMITGEVPFRGTNYLSIISQVLSQEPRRPSEVRPDLGISPALEAVVLKAMGKDRAVRYQTMADLDQDLASLQSGGDVVAVSGPHPVLVRRVASRPGRRARILAWIGGVVLVVAGVAAAVAVVVPRGASRTTVKVESAPPPPPAAAPAPAEPPAPPMVKIRVASTPPGADIWWGDRHMGVTPWVVEFPRGVDRNEFVLKLEGYRDAEVPFYPTSDQELKPELAVAPRSRPGRGGRRVKPAPADDKPPPPRKSPTGGETKPNPYD